MRLVALLFLSMITSNCLGQTASIVLPKTITAGELTRFDAKYDGDSISWSIYPPTRYSDALDRQTLVPFAEFVPKSGVEYMVTLWAFKNVDGKALNAKQEYVFKAGPSPPIPPVPPGPDPDPDPEPDNLSETAKKVRDWAKAVGNKTEAKKIAANYAGINASIAAGAYNNLDFSVAKGKIVSDLYTINHPISEANAAWNTFFKNLSGEMQSLDEAGKIPNLPSLLGILKSVQEGLEAVQ